ncbi:hypothetical protein [Methylocystis rosea]|uniref:hypothetical protein n=1 Tax=Methylocystis rosea TaxID=173366 RepID=UPI000373D684|nr:hypothetical protein [Methylocystis rosea]
MRYDFFDDPVDWAFAALFALLTLVAWGVRLWEPSIGGPLTNLALNFAALVVILLAAQYLAQLVSELPFRGRRGLEARRRLSAAPIRLCVRGPAHRQQRIRSDFQRRFV